MPMDLAQAGSLVMPRMVFSKKQSRKLYALANRGEISEKKVHEMHEGVNVKSLPDRVRNARRKVIGR